MNFTMTFPDKCTACGVPFTEGEVRICIIVAGSAWKGETTMDGTPIAILEDGAELWRSAAYHEGHEPPENADGAARSAVSGTKPNTYTANISANPNGE